MNERRCDRCAYRELKAQPDGVCHHSAHVDGPQTPMRWWCEHFWPADEPLSEPWEDRKLLLELHRAAIASHESAVRIHALWERQHGTGGDR